MDAHNTKKIVKKASILNIFKILKLTIRRTNKIITFQNPTSKLKISQLIMNNTYHQSILMLLKSKRNQIKIHLIMTIISYILKLNLQTTETDSLNYR